MWYGKYSKWYMSILIGAGIALMIILVSIILSQNIEREQLFLEGEVKSMPYMTEDKMKKLGDLYLKLNRKFEHDIEDFEMAEAPITNKKGEKIHYGVNGKENPYELINEDYVNGINIKYVKGNAIDRKDGESNFRDMIACMSATLGADIDRYDDEELEILFTKLFELTHTFTGVPSNDGMSNKDDTSKLYACDHGCRWSKYYCGDCMVQGTNDNGDTMPFYKMDSYMGRDKDYGLMYDPFLVKKGYYYKDLIEMTEVEKDFSTSYQYEAINVYMETIKVDGDEEEVEVHEKKMKMTKVIGDGADANELISFVEPAGFCSICSGGKKKFTSTTRQIGGCICENECFHGECIKIYSGEDDEEGTWYDAYLGKNKDECNAADVENAECTCEEEPRCKPPLYDRGFYVCNGHEHYACPGHILVYCMGHTNLNLEIKIMYNEEVISVMHDLLNDLI